MRNYAAWVIHGTLIVAIASVLLVLALIAEGETEAAANHAAGMSQLLALLGGAFVLFPFVADIIDFVHQRTGWGGWFTGDEQGFEVVINDGEGFDEEHADLLRDRLLDDGFHDHAVEVREVRSDAD